MYVSVLVCVSVMVSESATCINLNALWVGHFGL